MYVNVNVNVNVNDILVKFVGVFQTPYKFYWAYWPQGVSNVIVVNEERLSDETLISIAKDYDMIVEDNCVEQVIERFYWDIDAFKDKLVEIMTHGIKLKWNLKE